ncbi:hypothetical protein ACQEVB_28535 [Pseudonocardia sp. CA-107938]|uniref:hypothetical protein n=1 Tax=Pseudonocardia sp. CA-107938 TaxID=3240021 RepID=UPI003D8E346C
MDRGPPHQPQEPSAGRLRQGRFLLRAPPPFQRLRVIRLLPPAPRRQPANQRLQRVLFRRWGSRLLQRRLPVVTPPPLVLRRWHSLWPALQLRPATPQRRVLR